MTRQERDPDDGSPLPRTELSDRIGEIFPPAGLRIISGDLELRGIGPDEALALLAVAQRGVHPPEKMPFGFPWTDAPADELPLNFLQWWARHITTFNRERWGLDLAVVWQGRMVGVQGVETQDFLATRVGETGSWLGLEFHGRGIGTAMRALWCTFLFDHLDFEALASGSLEGNEASLRVSEKTGYRPNGVTWVAPRGERIAVRRMLLRPEDLTSRPALQISGLEPLRRFLGLDTPATQSSD